jgi:hypothetical protein
MSAAHRSSAEIRRSLDFPVIDADAHVVEVPAALLDFLKQVAGVDAKTAQQGVAQ